MPLRPAPSSAPAAARAEAATTPDARVRWSVRRYGWTLIAVFWGLQFAELSLIAFLGEPQKASSYYPLRCIVTALGVLITMGVLEVNLLTARRSFAARAAIAVTAATVGGVLVSVFNYYFFYVYDRPIPVPFAWGEILWIFVSFCWFLYAISIGSLAISYNIELRERDRRLQEMARIAHEAQMQALRYQLNPHFLFNTLNSISALVESGENAVANEMVHNLADFLRSTLETDPNADIRLEDELHLQKLYLDIERIRFPDRLRFSAEAPSELRDALVPSLITQPIIENAIKYAVAQSVGPVEVRLVARQAGARLRIEVSDTGASHPVRGSQGTGLGLANVRERLRLRFGDDQLLRAERLGAGFSVVVELPLRRGAAPSTLHTLRGPLTPDAGREPTAPTPVA